MHNTLECIINEATNGIIIVNTNHSLTIQSLAPSPHIHTPYLCVQHTKLLFFKKIIGFVYITNIYNLLNETKNKLT